MLAEELMRWAKRMLWDEGAGAFRESRLDPRHPFVLNCERRRSSAGWPSFTVRRVPVGRCAGFRCGLRGDTTRILSTLDKAYRHHGLTCAVYGLALTEWVALR